jgi:hypothetical protein
MGEGQLKHTLYLKCERGSTVGRYPSSKFKMKKRVDLSGKHGGVSLYKRGG